MKLYTEEQVRSLLNKMDIIYSLEDLTPIELPSDDEIEKEAFKVIPKFMTDPYEPLEDGNKEDRDVFIKGIKWMKEQILKQNK